MRGWRSGTGLVLVAGVLAGSGARAQDARLELHEPAARATVRGLVPLVEVGGRVAHVEPAPLDVVIALDVSESVFLPSGRDLDGNGVTGRLRFHRLRRADGTERDPRSWTTDPADSVFEAERAAAARVLEALPRSGVRAGLLSFADDVRVLTRLGPIERTRAALTALRPPSEPMATDLERAIRVGQDVLQAYFPDGHRKVLVLLSDGQATRPWSPYIADAAARRAARAAAREGVAIHAVALGPSAAGPGSAYAELAALSRGRFAPAERLDSLFAGPPLADPPAALLRVDVTNLTTGEPGRALRVAANGRFDAFVPLVAGRNRLRVAALTLDGARVSARRTVYFERPQTPSDDDRALARTLAQRARELDLAQPPSERSTVERLLEIEPEP